jgi:hypothetical protein
MSCTLHHHASTLVLPRPIAADRKTPRFVTVVATFLAALAEAWEMRCAIRKQYPFSDE